MATQQAVQESPAVQAANSQLEAQLHKIESADLMNELKAQPMVRIYVPLDETEQRQQAILKQQGDERRIAMRVQINGVLFLLPKGIYVDVPTSIADVAMHTLQNHWLNERPAGEGQVGLWVDEAFAAVKPLAGR